MYRHKNPTIHFSLVISLLVTGLIINQLQYPPLLTGAESIESLDQESLKKIKQNIKKEILQEISRDIKDLVKQEIETYITQNNNTFKKAAFLKENPNNTQNKTSNMPPLITKELLRKIVQDVVNQHAKIQELTNNELDNYHASSMETQTYIAEGYYKKTRDYMLAKASGIKETRQIVPKAETNASQENLGISGGAQKSESIERALVQRGGMLLPKGKLQLETSITYAQFSSNRISIQGFSIFPIIIIGQIATETVKRNVFIGTESVKYGIFHNFQGEIRVPYRYEHDRVTDTFDNETTRDFGGLGDAEAGLSRQITWENGIIPDILASISFKSATGADPYFTDIGIGTGHYALRGSLVAVKSSDPSVIFGSINYTWNIKRDIDDFAEVDPGDSIGFSIGTAIALSYQTAINFAYEQGITFKMKQNGQEVPATFLNTSTLKTGFTWALNERTSIDFSVGVGLTSDTPDVTVTLRVPYTF